MNDKVQSGDSGGCQGSEYQLPWSPFLTYQPDRNAVAEAPTPPMRCLKLQQIHCGLPSKKKNNDTNCVLLCHPAYLLVDVNLSHLLTLSCRSFLLVITTHSIPDCLNSQCSLPSRCPAPTAKQNLLFHPCWSGLLDPRPLVTPSPAI